MRSHGEPDWPDPTRQGTFKTALDLGSPQARAADFACRYLLPASGGHVGAAQLEKDTRAALKNAACMRAHGITNFPDPTIQPNGGSSVSLNGLDPTSPQFQSASKACGPR